MLEQAADLLRNAKRGLALTGAGFSTAAGIPDFRSASVGLWEGVEAISLEGFRKDPPAFYDWARPLARTMVNADPTDAHHALYRLQQMNLIQAVLTQNVDMLHQEAGCNPVYPLHGTMETVTCIDCGYHAPSAEFLPVFLEQEHIPSCPQCGGVVKPDIILFGESLDPSILLTARQQAAACDVLLIAGTTLLVTPAAELPEIAKANGARIIVINYDPTPIDDAADVLLRGDINQVLPELVTLVESQE